jgi:hypothetical protein
MHQRQPEEKMLAFRPPGRWNAQSFTANGLMTRKKFLLPDFDACSVALFASLVFMGPAPARGEPVTPTRPALLSSRAPSGPRQDGGPADRLDEDTPFAQRGRSRR